MPRFLLVRGRPGVLVPNPHVIGSNPPRFAGMKLDPNAPKGPLVSLHVPCDEVLLDSGDLRSAVKNGEIDLLRECVADNHAGARVAMAPPPPAKPGRNAPEVS